MAHQQLWLLRHGEAVPHESKADFDRELTPRGERQSVAAGEALARLGLEFAACYTSPLVRAAATAELACEPLNVTHEQREADRQGLRRRHGARAARRARATARGSSSSATTRRSSRSCSISPAARVDFKKGGVAGVRVSAGRGELLALMRPRELESLALSALPGDPG